MLALDKLQPSFGKKFNHEFLLFGVPEEKYGHHTALVHHAPKGVYRKVVAVFGRMEKEIADAELLGEIRMERPYRWDVLEEQAMEAETDAESLFQRLEGQTKIRQGQNLVPVAVYLVKVTTSRETLLFDGQKSSLPSGYLTYYTGVGKPPRRKEDHERVQCTHQ